MNTIVTGGSGLVGKHLKDILPDAVYISSKDFDLTDREATNSWFYNKYFDIVIHTAVKGGSRLLVDGGNVFYENIQQRRRRI